jgi:hypothetical protein
LKHAIHDVIINLKKNKVEEDHDKLFTQGSSPKLFYLPTSKATIYSDERALTENEENPLAISKIASFLLFLIIIIDLSKKSEL